MIPGLGHTRFEGLPWENRFNSGKWVLPGSPGIEKSLPDLREDADFLVDRLGRFQEGLLMSPLARAKSFPMMRSCMARISSVRVARVSRRSATRRA